MLRRLVFLAILLFCGWLALALYLFVRPRQDHPRHAAAIIVLAGDEQHRFSRGLELARSGVAPVLVVSDGARSDWAPARELCAHPRGHGFRVICFRPAPYSTRGEARGALALVRRNHWRSLLVVTSTYHVYRSRLLFDRCIKGQARVYATGARSSRYWLSLNMVSETIKLGPGIHDAPRLLRPSAQLTTQRGAKAPRGGKLGTRPVTMPGTGSCPERTIHQEEPARFLAPIRPQSHIFVTVPGTGTWPREAAALCCVTFGRSVVVLLLTRVPAAARALVGAVEEG